LRAVNFDHSPVGSARAVAHPALKSFAAFELRLPVKKENKAFLLGSLKTQAL
jgi:hypothetical protein